MQKGGDAEQRTVECGGTHPVARQEHDHSRASATTAHPVSDPFGMVKSEVAAAQDLATRGG